MKKILVAALLACTIRAGTAQSTVTTTLPEWDAIAPLLECSGYATLFSFEEQQRLRGAILIAAQGAAWNQMDTHYYMGWYDGMAAQFFTPGNKAEEAYFNKNCHLLGRTRREPAQEPMYVR